MPVDQWKYEQNAIPQWPLFWVLALPSNLPYLPYWPIHHVLLGTMTDLVCQYSFFCLRLRLHLRLHLHFTFLVFILYLHCCVFCYRETVLHTLVLHQPIDHPHVHHRPPFICARSVTPPHSLHLSLFLSGPSWTDLRSQLSRQIYTEGRLCRSRD